MSRQYGFTSRHDDDERRHRVRELVRAELTPTPGTPDTPTPTHAPCQTCFEVVPLADLKAADECRACNTTRLSGLPVKLTKDQIGKRNFTNGAV